MCSVSNLKLIAIAVISFGSFFFGILPNLFGLGTRLQNSVLLSSVLCFGGGVLFATSIIHILPDIRKDLSSWSEIVFCLGYLLIYFVDTVTILISKHQFGEESLITREDHRSYGTSEDDILETENERQLPEVRVKRNIKCLDLSLLFAFTVHSLLEGLVIGVESSKNGVLLLLTAVCSHKLLVAFCLGAELSSGGQPLHVILPALSIFVAGSTAGIGMGIVLIPEKSSTVRKLVPILQGLAGGTLLYVVVTEILPREKSRKLPKYAALAQYLSLCTGFLFMACLSTIT